MDRIELCGRRGAGCANGEKKCHKHANRVHSARELCSSIMNAATVCAGGIACRTNLEVTRQLQSVKALKETLFAILSKFRNAFDYLIPFGINPQ